MSKDREYCVVEHLWRLIRAAFLLAGTALWLFTDVSPWLIFSLYVGAAVVDQLHGVICRAIEKALDFAEQHNNWE